jgi:hypothetical protein
MDQQMKSQNLLKITKNQTHKVTYVENKSLKQEVAELVTDFSNFYSKKQNTQKVKAVLNGFVDDLNMHACNIKNTKKNGVGKGIIKIIFPNAVKGIENANKKSNKTKCDD